MFFDLTLTTKQIFYYSYAQSKKNLLNNAQDSTGLDRTQQDLTGLDRTQKDSIGLNRTQQDLTRFKLMSMSSQFKESTNIRVMKVLKTLEYHHWHSLKSKLDYQ